MGDRKVICPEKAEKIEGQPIRLSSEFAGGRVLSITRDGEPYLDYPGSAHDDRWSIVKMDAYDICSLLEHQLCGHGRIYPP